MKHKFTITLLLVSLISVAQVKEQQLNLMPWPQSVVISEGVFNLNKNFKINITGNGNPRIFVAATNFLRRLDARTGLFFEQGFLKNTNEVPDAQLQINCLGKGSININQDETYTLQVLPNKITINAPTDLGALHALETLLQLVQNDSSSFYFPAIQITDAPRFAWRGLMIDAARHFQPVDVIKRNIDAMAMMKMNVFHWHLADDQGWRIEMKKNPKLSELASDGNFYTQEEIKNIVKYAQERGILVVPEIDVPGHATAILTAYPEIGSQGNNNQKLTIKPKYDLERNAGIFTPTLDPSNPRTYQLLGEIFDEVCPLFSGPYFHIGGDENEGKDWDANSEIQAFKKKNNLKNNHELQTYFTIKLIPMLKKHNKELMGWEEIMTAKMPKEAIIHSWKGPNEGFSSGKSLVEAAKKGYKTVLSNGFYIDLMQSVDTHYLNEPIPKDVLLSPEEKERILGGEATMWSELVTPLNIDSRIWPRTAAIAERLWSSENVTDLYSMHKRLKAISFKLEEVGITHIRNKAVILRNIANNHNTSALEDFSAICEPLKIYTRNSGGTEYKMFSPFSLFADACTPDATDALLFNEAVEKYLVTKNIEDAAVVTGFLQKWVRLYLDLAHLSENAPLVQSFLPLSKSLSDLSQELLFVLDKNQSVDPKNLKDLWEQCNSKKYADIELAVCSGLKKLMNNLTP